MNAITVENLSFSYGSNRVLDDICVEIKFNQIYALLGPSGGGKTTLLRLILGTIPVQKGLIRVMGEEPGLRHDDISFMPQDCALCPYFTVSQTLNYFKNIYCLSQKEYNKRYAELRTLLDLPSDDDLLVSQLSGGQQRRLSIAIALINRPTLVILDEPTVGIDPIVRDEFWKYLINECKQCLTVVLVTHYVEEAINADRVALMRNGRIMIEESPNHLLNNFQTNSLENIFLRLCLTEDKAIENNENVFYKNKIDSKLDNNFKHQINGNKSAESLKKKLFNTWILFILIHKNILKFLYQIIFIIILPTTQVILLGMAYSKDTISLKTGIFNEELVPKHSLTLLSNFNENNNRYRIESINYSSIGQAVKALESVQTIASIHIPKHFSDAIDRRVTYGLLANNQTIIESSVGLYLDNSILVYSNAVIESLSNTMIALMSKLYSQQNQTFNGIAIKVEKTHNSQHIQIVDYYTPGYYLFFLYLSLLSLSSLLLTQDRRDGLFERSLIAGISHELVFLSHLITCCLISILQILLLFTTRFVIFNTVNNGSILLVFFYLFIHSLNTISTGLLISALVERDIVSVMVVCFITFPQMFSSGLYWPLEAVPYIHLKYIFEYLNTLSIPVQTMRNIMLRGMDLHHRAVLNGFLFSFISSLIYITIALIAFKRKLF